MQLIFGFILSAFVSLLAFNTRALSKSGAIAAFVSGGIVFGFGGWQWALLLLAFFLSSSILSKLLSPSKVKASENFSKGSRRDWGQVLANGGVGAMLVILAYLNPEQPWIFIAFAGSIAAVNADTWGTELGVLSSKPPRLITNGKEVEPGTSGAVSVVGSLASLTGAGVIATLAALILYYSSSGMITTSILGLMVVITFSGYLGSLIDSLLGATIQVVYFCPRCQKETEQHPVHHCGAETTQERGWRRITNDQVNLLCSVTGAIVTGGMVLWLNFY
jgi:uncharacterized protein (TIGR00297 family)